MDVLFFVLGMIALVLVWRWVVTKFLGQHWVVRHILGFCAGIIAFALLIDVAGALGLVDTTAKVSSQEELTTDTKTVKSTVTQELIPSDSTPTKEYQTVESLVQEFKPRLIDLVEKGVAMEPYRMSTDHSDIRQCGDMMQANKAALEKLRSDLSLAFDALPAALKFNPEFEPIHNGTANLIRCVTCVPSAMADCRAAAGALEMNF